MLTREEVVSAYRLFLGREPESDDVVQIYMGLPSLQELSSVFAGSDEFRQRHGIPSRDPHAETVFDDQDTSPPNPRVEAFTETIRPTLEGWVGPRLPLVIDILDKVQSDLGIDGDIAEIGVHHGLFLLLLAATRRGEQSVRAFDIFEQQELNVDHSGMGSSVALANAIRRHYPAEESWFVVTQIDSLAIRPPDLARFFPKSVRLFSVDGGHTIVHVNNDLNIAQDVMAPGGIVMLDDFFGPHWPDVTVGFLQFMSRMNRRLAPFLFFENKLFLTTFSEHALVSARFRSKLSRAIGEEMRNGLWKDVELSGFRVLAGA